MLMVRRDALRLLGLAFAGACGVLSAARADTYPSNPIRIIVPTGPGTPPDIISRLMAAEASRTEGWRFVVENKPGALQTIGMAEALKQPADGYVIYPMSVPTAAVPALMPQLNLRPEADFAAVIKISKSYNVLVVPPSLPVNSVADLVAMLKQAPGKFNFSSAGFGTPAHLIGEMFKLRTGVSAAHVPYQQAQQRMGDLLNGTNHFDFVASVTAAEFVATGKLRAVAVTAPERVRGLPGVPTVVEQGFPELVVEDYVGFAVKGGTPKEIVARLNQAMNRALAAPKVGEALAKLGAMPGGGTAAEFADLIGSQTAHWRKVVSDAGIKMPQ